MSKIKANEIEKHDASEITINSDTHVKDPLEKRGFDSNFWIWEYADYNKKYMVVADVARGD